MENPNMDPKLLSKLSKILALSKHGVGGEAENASAMLARMLTEHNLEIADLERSGQAEAPKVGEGKLEFERKGMGRNYRKMPEWRIHLAEYTAGFFFCHALVNRYSAAVAFIGRPDNVATMKAMYNFFAGQLEELSRTERIRHREETGEDIHPMRWQPTFCNAAVVRLHTRLKEQREEQAKESAGVTALVVSHKSEISDWMEAQGLRRIDGQKTKRELEWEAKREAEEREREELLASDPEAAYERWPYLRPETEEQKAARRIADLEEELRWEKAQEAQRKRMETMRRNGTLRTRSRDWEADDQKADAASAGRKAADRINLQPLVKAGTAPAGELS